MITHLKKALVLGSMVLLLAGCVSSMSGSSMNLDPLVDDHMAMPDEDARISTAIAVQSATAPMQRYKNVVFAPGAQGRSEPELGKAGFEFTGAKLYTTLGPSGSKPGESTGIVELTDPLGRKASFLYNAQYTVDNDIITITSLKMVRSYEKEPRVDFVIVKAKDLPNAPLHNYADLIAFLAEKGVTLQEYKTLPEQEFALFAVGKDWAGPESNLTIGVSASKTGTSGYTKSSNFSLIEEKWPLAVTFGTIDPGSAKSKLYAKVNFRMEGGFSTSNRVGVYQLSAFDK